MKVWCKLTIFIVALHLTQTFLLSRRHVDWGMMGESVMLTDAWWEEVLTDVLWGKCHELLYTALQFDHFIPQWERDVHELFLVDRRCKLIFDIYGMTLNSVHLDIFGIIYSEIFRIECLTYAQKGPPKKWQHNQILATVCHLHFIIRWNFDMLLWWEFLFLYQESQRFVTEIYLYLLHYCVIISSSCFSFVYCLPVYRVVLYT